ncbi:LysR family transcriptional regulator [Zoogloea sp.]|jgi:DNA-binding transcriptional LysR family regulator|uniref:LysR family transcriptional regulator n=1 Tax=Zoogloea sp. TaxID=49181 RepID=UPI0037D9F50F
MDRLDGMAVFIRVAEAGSFTAVAEHLGLARSAVTRSIAALEAHLGVKLIARSTRSLKLTAEGEVYLERCREILALVDAAEGDLSGDDRTPRGPIRISVPVSFGVRHLAPLVADFITTFPGVNLDIDFNDRQVNLIESGLDMAIRITTQLDPTQVARRISTSRLLTLASPEYLARHGRPQTPADLAAHQCLGYTGTARATWPYRIDGEMQWVPVQGRLQANSGDALVDACQRGLGIVRQPSFIAAPAIRAGLLEVLLVDFPGPELGIHAVFPSNRYLPTRVRALADYLAERIGPSPYWDAGLP